MYQEIQESMDRTTTHQFSLQMDRCFFKARGTPGCEGLFPRYDPLFFYVNNASRLSPSTKVIIDSPYVVEHKIRVI